jgi:threonine dehydrogenase-like Zn-dependent dehydrogenase
MKTAVYDGTPTIKLTEQEIPRIGPKEALLKVHACGICATDLRILNFGHFRIPKGVRRVLGHELSGEIVEVGEQVSWPCIGMRVSLSPNIGCGHCDNCIQGNTHICADYLGFGVGIDGGFAEYMLIPEAAIRQGNVVELPDGISYEEAAVNEPLSCAYRGMMACQPKPNENVLIIGAGPIGLMHMRIAQMVGAGKVIISEINPQRVKEALAMGARYVVNPLEQDFSEYIQTLTRGKGIDVGIIAVGSAAAQKQCLEVMNYQGRVNFFGGLPKDAVMTTLNANLVHYRELVITGTTGQTVKQYRTVLGLVANHQIEIRDLISKKFSLADITEAIEYARSQQGLKTLIVPND